MSKLPPLRRPIVGQVQVTRPLTKIAPHSIDRTKAQPSTRPEAATGAGDNRTKVFTYQTKPGEDDVLYPGDRLWAKVTLLLETGGPVAIGDSSKLAPVMGGQGQTLETGVPVEIIIAKGTKLYINSTAVNRVKVRIEPLPWLEQITATIMQIASGIISAIAAK